METTAGVEHPISEPRRKPSRANTKSADDVEALRDGSADEVMQRLKTSVDGLSTNEAEARLATYGPNTLEEEHEPLWRRIPLRTSGDRSRG